jgi:hypothetical protein
MRKEARSWKVEGRSSKLEAGGWRLETEKMP